MAEAGFVDGGTAQRDEVGRPKVASMMTACDYVNVLMELKENMIPGKKDMGWSTPDSTTHSQRTKKQKASQETRRATSEQRHWACSGAGEGSGAARGGDLWCCTGSTGVVVGLVLGVATSIKERTHGRLAVDSGGLSEKRTRD
ncbi:hypothetical protein U1Q18_000604 [Sarracenia purpurea var. burkii]